MNRKYLSEKPVLNLKKQAFAYNIFAENTQLHLIERLQGEWKYNGASGQKIVFTIKFEDTGLVITSKCKDSAIHRADELYVKYALDLMDDDTYEEYYKAALLLTKNSLKISLIQFEEAEVRFKEKGYWEYPYNTDIKMYKYHYDLEKRTYESINIEESDLKYFKGYN